MYIIAIIAIVIIVGSIAMFMNFSKIEKELRDEDFYD